MIGPKMCLLSLFLMGDWMVSLPIHVNMCPLDITYLNTSLCIDLSNRLSTWFKEQRVGMCQDIQKDRVKA